MNKYIQLLFVLGFGILCGYGAVQLNHLRPDYNPITGEYSDLGTRIYQKAQVQGEFLGDVAPKYDPVGQPYKCFAVMCKDKRIILLDAIPGEEKGCIPQFWEDTNNVCNDK